MIHFVVALASEAQPIVARFGLQAVSEARPFKVYRQQEMWLIVSGVGKTASAAATGYLYALSAPDGPAGWINTGICGHGKRMVGEAILANKITDAAAGRSWYPSLPSEVPCATDEVVTVDRVEEQYRQACAYDMEATGFYATASRLASRQLVHCFKVVSDNPSSNAEQLTAGVVEELIAGQISVLERLVRETARLTEELRCRLS